jgi:hypothetical protein
MTDRINLNVPFAEKDEARALGAWWDPEARTWFVPAGKDPGPFERWLPASGESDADGRLELKPPIFTVESRSACWKCDTVVPVATIACTRFTDSEGETGDGEETLYLFSGIDWLPEPALEALRRVNPGYRMRFSKTAGCEYFMNHCPCGAQLGDFFMHSEPGGAFFPMDEDSARRITLRGLAVDGSMEMSGDPGTSVPNLIWEYARRLG